MIRLIIIPDIGEAVLHFAYCLIYFFARIGESGLDNYVCKETVHQVKDCKEVSYVYIHVRSYVSKFTAEVPEVISGIIQSSSCLVYFQMFDRGY